MNLNSEFQTGLPKPRAHLEVRQQPDISRDFMCRRTEARQRRQDVDVDLTRIRLGRDGIGVSEPAQLGDAIIQRLYFCMVTVEEGQKTGLGTRRSLRAPEADVVSCPFEVPKVPKEFLSADQSEYTGHPHAM